MKPHSTLFLVLFTFSSGTKAQLPLDLKVMTLDSTVLFSSLLLPTPDNGVILFANPDRITVYPSFDFGKRSIIKMDSIGTVKWARSYKFLSQASNSMLARFISCVQTEDSTFAVVGIVTDTSNLIYKEYGVGFCMKFKANGDTLWSKKLVGTKYPTLHPLDVTMMKDSSLLICGQALRAASAQGSLERQFIAKLSKDGNLLWCKADSMLSASAALSVKQTPDGGFITTGGIDPFSNNSSLFLSKYSSAGILQWSKKYKRGTSTIGTDLLVDSTGYLVLNFSNDLALLRTDHQGNIQWNKKFTSSLSSSLYDKYTNNYKITSIKGSEILVSARTEFGHTYKLNSGLSAGTEWGKYNYTYSDAVQLINGRFFFIGNEFRNFISKTKDSLVPGDLQLVITNAAATGTAFCFTPGTITITQPSIDVSSNTSNFVNAGVLEPFRKDLGFSSLKVKEGCVGWLPDGIQDYSLSPAHIYPQPCNGILNLKTPNSLPPGSIFNLYDISGKEIHNFVLDADEEVKTIMLPPIPAGIYLYSVSSETRTLYWGKVAITD